MSVVDHVAHGLDAEAVVARAVGTLSRRTMDGVAILPPEGDLVCLDLNGAIVWHLLDAARNVAELLDDVALAYGVDASEVRLGTTALLVTLRDTGAITVAQE